MKAEVVECLERLFNGIYEDKGEYSTFKFNAADVDIDCVVDDNGWSVAFEPWADRRFSIFANDSVDEAEETVVDVIAYVMSNYHGISEVLSLGANVDLGQIPSLLEAMESSQEG